MSDLLSLAARVEAAEGPDRELDLSIAVCVRGLVPIHKYEGGGTYFNGIRNLDWFENETLGPIPANEPEDLGAFEGWSNFRIPPFTASLDAAMSLVPEGCSVTLSLGATNIALVTDCSREGEPPDYEATAATPALALCAASLRARAALEGLVEIQERGVEGE